VSRRVTVAVDAGVLRNLEDRKGRPARLVLGDPLPDEIELLPKPERLHGCTVAEADKLVSADSGNGSRCAYCGTGELADDPLLTASTDGELFFTHRRCLDRELWTLRRGLPLRSRPINTTHRRASISAASQCELGAVNSALCVSCGICVGCPYSKL
jgi:hypothetical protein